MTSALWLAFSLAAGPLPIIQSPAPSCEAAVYLGFDTRLKAQAIVRFPIDREEVLGFEVKAKRPLLALKDRLIGFDGSKLFLQPVPTTISGLSFDRAGALYVQNANGIGRLDGKAIKPVTLTMTGRMLNSGTDAFLDIAAVSTQTTLTLRRLDGRVMDLVSAEGAVGAASWSPEGLAAVIGDTLFTWTPGAKALARLWTDSAASRIHDVAVVGDRRVAVATKRSLMLVSQGRALVLGGIGGRVRWSDGLLFVADEQTGIVWQLAGLGKIGDRADDEQYAAALVRVTPAQNAEKHSAFMEAARIIGCDRATALLSRRR